MQTNSQEAVAEIRGLAQKIEAHRAAKNWSQAKLLREYDGLGSSKVWWGISEGKTDELDIDGRWLPEYRAVVVLIEAEQQAHDEGEDLYDDLLPVIELARVTAPLFRTDGNDRVVVYQGEPGSGKTTAARLLAKRFASKVMMIEAIEAWGDNPAHLLGAILNKFGIETLPDGAAARMNKTLEMMTDTRRVLIVDEAHHLGPRQLNVIKTLVNQRKWGFLLLCIGTLWRKLERTSYEEARQLTTNRLAERVKLLCPAVRDVERMLERRVPGIDKAVVSVGAKAIATAAQTHGGLGFVRDVCSRLHALGDGKDIGKEDAARAIEKELASR